MHELAVTQSMLNLALDHAPPQARVTDLHVVIGELSSFVDDSVHFYWDIIAAGTMAEGAQLHFRREQAQMVCELCTSHYDPRQTLTCPLCGGSQTRLVAGEAFYLEAIEVQQPAEVQG